MNVNEWHSRLNETFLNGSIFHDELERVKTSEIQHSLYCQRNISGHVSLFESLQAFILETFSKTAESRSHPSLKGKSFYDVFLFEFVMAFRTIRSCENQLFMGYAFHGYASLRTLKEQVFFLTAIAKGETTFNQLYGIRDGMTRAELENERAEIRKRAMNEESRVQNLLLRQAQDLGSHKEVLLRWERHFNLEVHGQKGSTSILMMAWHEGKRDLPYLAEYDEELISNYLNRATEIAWMLVRLLPILQPEPGAFGAE